MINKYEVIAKVAETRNITKAAEALGYTQSGISHIVNSFEEEIGIKVFQRGRGGVNLTTTGTELMPYINEIVEKIAKFDKKISEVSRLHTGKVKIASLTTISAHILPKIIKSFNESYPNISVNLEDCNYTDIEDLVSQSKVDLGFVPAPIKKGLDSLCLFTDNYVVISAKNRILSESDHVKLSDLDNEKILLVDGITRDIKAICAGNEQILMNMSDINSTYVTLRMVKENVGISIFPEVLARDEKENLNIYKIDDAPPRRICMIAKDFSKLSPSASKFVKFFENEKPDTL